MSMQHFSAAVCLPPRPTTPKEREDGDGERSPSPVPACSLSLSGSGWWSPGGGPVLFARTAAGMAWPCQPPESPRYRHTARPRRAARSSNAVTVRITGCWGGCRVGRSGERVATAGSRRRTDDHHLASFKIAGARTSTRKERNRGERERENYRAGAARGRRAARTCPARSRWECLRGKCYVSDRPLGRAEPVSVPVRLAPERTFDSIGAWRMGGKAPEAAWTVGVNRTTPRTRRDSGFPCENRIQLGLLQLVMNFSVVKRIGLA